MTSWIDRLKATKEGQLALVTEGLMVDATELIAEAMESEGISRAELARRIDRSPAFVTKVLRGTSNFTLRTLAHILFALGYTIRLRVEKVDAGSGGWPAPASAANSTECMLRLPRDQHWARKDWSSKKRLTRPSLSDDRLPNRPDLAA